MSLSTSEIDWIAAAANYVKRNVGKESYLLREAIGSTSERLDQDRFLRIHRSLIGNVRKIKELQPFEIGEYIAILKNGKELSCSRGYRAKYNAGSARTLDSAKPSLRILKSPVSDEGLARGIAGCINSRRVSIYAANGRPAQRVARRADTPDEIATCKALRAIPSLAS